jgi:23S rRNA pseudouridine1911/1915/1917 synthase
MNMRKAGDTSVADVKEGELFAFVVPREKEGQRLDQYLVEKMPDLSRSRLSSLIRSEFIRVNGVPRKAANRLKEGDRIEAILPPLEPLNILPEKVEFIILYEDSDLLVISKPPGIVVHPACGHKKGTLVHGLMAHCDNLSGISGIERPGIVHRLDKDTSGIMVIAKNDRSHHGLVELFKARKIHKVYQAIVVGHPTSTKGCISQPIGRHRSSRKKMAVLPHGGRDAVTCWETLEEFSNNLTYLEVTPTTGRTHQIRVHMAFLGHPVAGDVLYGSRLIKTVSGNLDIKRQCLHAHSLSFQHPVTGQKLEFVAPLWPDMMGLLLIMRKLYGSGAK